MCIYYGDKEGLTYREVEHVFPAGIGGISVLERGMVSDQANSLFSKLELKFMHESLIALTRVLFGPGKRGSHAGKDMAKTRISIVNDDDGKLTLGYISGKAGYYIDCLAKHGEVYTFTVGSEHHDDPLSAWSAFCGNMMNMGSRFVSITSKELEPGDWIAGFYNSKYYIAHGDDLDLSRVKRTLKALTEISKPGKLNGKMTQPKFDISLMDSDEITRVFAKTAINVLAHLKGPEFVGEERFSEIKNWIIGEGNGERFTQLPRINIDNPLRFPKNAHWCIFQKIGGKLVAVVCFYNAYSKCFELAEALPTDPGIPFGFICDWENKKEYTLEQWVYSVIERRCGYSSTEHNYCSGN